nr:RNA polymerase [Flumine tombus-like virus 25]
MEIDPPTILHPRVRVMVRDDPVKERRSWHLVNSPSVQFRVFNNTLDNLLAGVIERVFYVRDKTTSALRAPYTPIDDDRFMSRLSRFGKLMSRLATSRHPWSKARFTQCYTGKKLAVYLEAVESLKHNPPTREDSVVKIFIKRTEKTNLSAKSRPVPRVISPRDPRYNVALGCYVKKIEHDVYNNIARVYGSSTVLKGMNARQQGEVIQSHFESYSECAAIGLDASRFDQHVSKSALRFEHSVYKRFYPGDNKLTWLLDMQLVNRCRGFVDNGGVKYVVDGTRMSGDMNTGLGNCLIMCALVYSYAAERNVGIRLANNGDDCVVFMDRRDELKFKEGLHQWFREMGFDMKVDKTVYHVEGVVFCQTQPVWDGDGYIMCRDPVLGLGKDHVSVRSLNSEKDYNRWIAAVGEGGISLAGGLPVFQDFYRTLVRDSKGAKPLYTALDVESGQYKLRCGLHRKYKKVSDETRNSFYLAFGITPDHLEESSMWSMVRG